MSDSKLYHIAVIDQRFSFSGNGNPSPDAPMITREMYLDQAELDEWLQKMPNKSATELKAFLDGVNDAFSVCHDVTTYGEYGSSTIDFIVTLSVVTRVASELVPVS